MKEKILQKLCVRYIKVALDTIHVEHSRCHILHPKYQRCAELWDKPSWYHIEVTNVDRMHILRSGSSSSLLLFIRTGT